MRQQRDGRLDANLLILSTLALVAFGLVMVYSATSAAAAVDASDPSYYLARQGLYAAVGLALMGVLSRVHFRKLRNLAGPLVGVTLVLLLGVLAAGQTVNGARRWIGFGSVTFQPSELAKLALAVWAAAYLSRARVRPPQTLRELARPFGLMTGVFSALLLAQPDLGTAIALLLMTAGILVVAGTPIRPLAAGLSLAVAAGLLAIWLEPYRRARIFAFLDPWNDAQGAGFQTVQAMIGLGSGGLFGVGLGEGVQKIFYLPEAHTDMIFAIIGEELGLVGSLLVVAGYVAFGFAGFRIALACRDPFGKRLAAGLTVLVCGQAVVNLAAVMGIAPLTGIPLPFVSYGGTSLVVLLAGVGILLNIAWRGGEAAARVPDRSRRDGRARPAVARDRRGAERPRRPRDVRRVAGSHRG